jgi:hypothetical protein
MDVYETSEPWLVETLSSVGPWGVSLIDRALVAPIAVG